MRSETITLVVAGLGICGTLGGIVVGHLLTRSWQRDQWLMDRRHEEFQEIIKVLDSSMHSEATRNDDSMELTPAERRDKARRTSDFFTTLRTRIYTRDLLDDLDIDRDWRIALAAYQKDNDGNAFGEAYSSISRRLVKAATSLRAKTLR